MADLLINSKDAFVNYGVRMGNGFLNSLRNPLEMKDDVENESRLEDGKRVLVRNRKVASRALNLEFTIQGSTPSDFESKKTSFLELLYAGTITLQVPQKGSEIYRLLYKGTSQTYAESKSGCFCKMNLRFEEANPRNRGK